MNLPDLKSLKSQLLCSFQVAISTQDEIGISFKTNIASIVQLYEAWLKSLNFQNDLLRDILKSVGYSDEECDELLAFTKNADDKGKKEEKPKYVQPNYHKPPDTLKGFPDAHPVKSKNGRKRWKEKKNAKRIFEWDSRHNNLEGWDKTGKRHLGSFNPDNGNQEGASDPTKRHITPQIDIPMKKKVRYALAWYSIEDETWIGEVAVQLSQDTVREWFYLSSDDSAIECYDVTASLRKHLEELSGQDI